MRALIIIVPILLFQINIVFAQNPYIREGSIGKQNEPKEQTKPSKINPLSFRPLEKCVGEKFIFLPKKKDLQEYGYSSFYEENKNWHNTAKYEECVGRIGTITKVSSGISGHITLQMDDNGQVYIGTGSECVDGIAPVADLDYARNNFLGKTMWLGFKGGIVTYDKTTDNFGGINIKQFSTVKVVEVVAGWYSHEPIRFVLQTPSGEEGFVDVTLSGTNVPDILRDLNSFNDHFFTEDPKKIYKWPSKVWTAIEEGKIFISMTAKQVQLSWGRPLKINTTIRANVKNEQWVYIGNQYLYFENGVLTSIQK